MAKLFPKALTVVWTKSLLTRFDIALSPDSETVYGGDYSFDISVLVRFDVMMDFKADTAAYSGRDIPRNMQTITLNYDGTGSDFFTSGTASLNADVTHTHTISEGYSYDETSHWKTCTGCDDKIDLEKHSFDGGVIITQQPRKQRVKRYISVQSAAIKRQRESAGLRRDIPLS